MPRASPWSSPWFLSTCSVFALGSNHVSYEWKGEACRNAFTLGPMAYARVYMGMIVGCPASDVVPSSSFIHDESDVVPSSTFIHDESDVVPSSAFIHDESGDVPSSAFIHGDDYET